MKWMPIETAPIGEVVIVTGNIGIEEPTIVSAVYDEGWWPNKWATGDDPINPTHWMPLPAPPPEDQP